MKKIEELTDEELNLQGPDGTIDRRTAEKLGVDVKVVVDILEAWENIASEVTKERMRRRKLASPSRTVVR